MSIIGNSEDACRLWSLKRSLRGKNIFFSGYHAVVWGICRTYLFLPCMSFQFIRGIQYRRICGWCYDSTSGTKSMQSLFLTRQVGNWGEFHFIWLIPKLFRGTSMIQENELKRVLDKRYEFISYLSTLHQIKRLFRVEQLWKVRLDYDSERLQAAEMRFIT